jgi:hypothetical protein
MMPATAPRRSRPDEHARDREFAAAARALRQRLAAAATARRAAAEELLAPFRPRPGFTPFPSKEHLARLQHRWRALPAFGRLRLRIKQERATLELGELRAAPAAVHLPDWDGDAVEAAVAIEVFVLVIKPPLFWETTTTLASVGAHALARRYRRGFDNSETAVLRDLARLGAAAPAAIRAGGECDLPAGWRGAVWRTANGPLVAVRTFL